ncbi:MAG: prepilin-type N-terminal cleavage/methylation domain-containing protein [Sarcina sp.]
MERNLKKKKGLTLLELIIVLGLMGIVTSLIFSFVNTTQKKSKELDIRQELQFEGTMITESMMGNVLEMAAISDIEFVTTGTGVIDGSKIKSITFDLIGTGQYKKDPNLDKVSKIKYSINEVNKEIELEAFQLDSVDDLEKGHWEFVQIVSEYVKEISIENKGIKDFINANKTPSTEESSDYQKKLKIALAKEKSVNLKIVLEDDYYDEMIEHTHTIELSLRNAR